MLGNQARRGISWAGQDSNLPGCEEPIPRVARAIFLRVGAFWRTCVSRLGRAVATAAAVGLIATPGAIAWPGRPPGAPPKLSQPGPPPAWLETATSSRWLAFSGYCWKTRCVDMLPPAGRPDLPSISARRGQLLRFHLRFLPRRADVAVLVGGSVTRYALHPAQTVMWRAAKAGIVTLEVRTASGSAGYLTRLALR